MPDYSQIAFALSSDDSELAIFFAGQKKGTAAINAIPVISSNTYLQPNGVSNYFQPDGVSKYIQPA